MNLIRHLLLKVQRLLWIYEDCWIYILSSFLNYIVVATQENCTWIQVYLWHFFRLSDHLKVTKCRRSTFYNWFRLRYDLRNRSLGVHLKTSKQTNLVYLVIRRFRQTWWLRRQIIWKIDCSIYRVFMCDMVLVSLCLHLFIQKLTQTLLECGIHGSDDVLPLFCCELWKQEVIFTWKLLWTLAW